MRIRKIQSRKEEIKSGNEKKRKKSKGNNNALEASDCIRFTNKNTIHINLYI